MALSLDSLETSQYGYLSAIDQVDLKARGQFFTSTVVATFMASLFDVPSQQSISLIDAGAGAGILAAAVADRIATERPGVSLSVILYETDAKVIPLLRETMARVAEHYASRSMGFRFDIRQEDFLLSRPDRTDVKVDLAIVNPPYFKIDKRNSSYSGITSDIYIGDPNAYSAFVAVLARMLVPNGQLVSITPRSFMNGLYFKGFRQWLVRDLSLSRIHIFESRSDAFRENRVLQENVICHLVKTSQKPAIRISTSRGRSDIHDGQVRDYRTSLILDQRHGHNFIRVPENHVNGAVLELAEDWPETFESLGYVVSTGPVVTFRQWQYIQDAPRTNQSVPLINMHNVRPFRVNWTGTHKKDVRFGLFPGYAKYLSQNRNVVVLKRFSSKDERRRLIAGVYEKTSVAGSLVGFENHLNCISDARGVLDLPQAYGLAGLFNSVLIDRYFRSISGNTQVNATELRLMRLPSREAVREIGTEIMASDFSPRKVEEIVLRVLRVDERLANRIAEAAAQ